MDGDLSHGSVAIVRAHIRRTWAGLTRDLSHIEAAAADEKIGGEPLVYVARSESVEEVARTIRQRSGGSALEVRCLPPDISEITHHGLLYLPGAYVVPGGRFNEMHGWDSYFIALGLIEDGMVELAKSIADQQIYEVTHYGMVLNANRSYFLTRSHPPLLGRLVLAVYQETRDTAWLEGTIPHLESYYYYWATTPHLVQTLGLSRYWDEGAGPAPEVVASEIDEDGFNHYQRIAKHLLEVGCDDYDVRRFVDAETGTLTPEGFKNDRSMRESGFDPSGRFGLFNLEVTDLAPVCLNTLLYQMERDIAEALRLCGEERLAPPWDARAEARAATMRELMWDSDDGMFYDYHLREQRRRRYPFATTFWPLWAGLASAEEAARVRDEALPLLESAGGLAASEQVTGAQWDAPFAWAPLQLFAVEGLRRYGYEDDARRIASKFVGLVAAEFHRTGTMVEKYDAETLSADVSYEIAFGYTTNEVGFGWTNAVTSLFLRFLGVGK